MTSSHREKILERLNHLGQKTSTETAHFHQLAAAQLGLSPTDTKALSIVMQEQSMTAGQLAIRLGLTTGAITSIIDRLLKAHFVVRESDPDDRRRVIIRPNTDGLNTAAEIYKPMGEASQKLFESFTTEELEIIAAYLERAHVMTKDEIVKLSHRDL